jgi:hypothetical protein
MCERPYRNGSPGYPIRFGTAVRGRKALDRREWAE